MLRVVVESPSLGGFKNHEDVALGAVGHWMVDVLRGHFQPKQFCEAPKEGLCGQLEMPGLVLAEV